jgi:MFS family permease
MQVKARQTIVLITSIFIFTLGFGIIIPILPYYTKSVGATAFDLGLLLATFSFLQFFCGPFWGKISDKVGRKPVMMAGLLGFAIAFTIIGFSGGMQHGLSMMYLAVIIGGSFSAGILPAALAFIADITRSRERARLMGLMGAATGIGLILGPFISSVLSVFGLSAPFFVAASISIITMIAGYALLPESVSQERRLNAKDVMLPLFVAGMVKDTFAQMLSALWTPVGVFLAVTLIISFAIAGFEGTFAYFIMDRFGLTSEVSPVQIFNSTVSLTGPNVMGIVFALMGAVSVLCQGLIVGRAIEYLKVEKVILIGLFICAAGLLLMLVARDLGSLILYICVISVGSGLIFPCLNTVVSERTDENNQGVVMGIMGSYGNFGRILGPPIAGYTYGLNLNLPYFISAAIMAFSSIAIILLIRIDQKKDERKLEGELTVKP